MVQTAKLPRYEVEALQGEISRSVIELGDDGTRTVKEVSEPAGYMVYFSKGHSIRVRDDKELRRLGFDRPAPIDDVDVEDTMRNVTSPKEMTLRKTKPTRRSAELEVTD